MVEVNLLPVSQRRQSSGAGQQGWIIAAAMTGLISLGTIAGLELYYASQINGLRTDLDRLNGEIAALEPAKTEFDKLQAEKADLEKVTNVARTLRDSKSYWSNDLAAFTAQLPAGNKVTLTSLDMRPAAQQSPDMQQSGVEGGSVSREVVVAATATTAQAVVDVLNAYENNPKFGIVFGGMQRVNPEDEASPYRFDATVGIAGMAPGASALGAATASGAATTSSAATASGAVASDAATASGDATASGAGGVQ